MSSNNTIFLFNGEGTNTICVEETERFVKKKIDNYHLIQVDQSYIEREAAPCTYIFPGGQALYMGRALMNVSQKIHQAIVKGSNILGICAGGLVACSDWEYYCYSPRYNQYEILSSKSFKDITFDLGPSAIGPTYLLAEESRVALVNFPTINKTIKCFWKQGPVFFSEAQVSHIWGQYLPDPQYNHYIHAKNSPAALHFTKGLGNAVLLGIHPELAEYAAKLGNFTLTEEDLEGNDQVFLESFKKLGIKN